MTETVDMSQVYTGRGAYTDARQKPAPICLQSGDLKQNQRPAIRPYAEYPSSLLLVYPRPAARDSRFMTLT